MSRLGANTLVVVSHGWSRLLLLILLLVASVVVALLLLVLEGAAWGGVGGAGADRASDLAFDFLLSGRVLRLAPDVVRCLANVTLQRGWLPFNHKYNLNNISNYLKKLPHPTY